MLSSSRDEPIHSLCFKACTVVLYVAPIMWLYKHPLRCSLFHIPNWDWTQARQKKIKDLQNCRNLLVNIFHSFRFIKIDEDLQKSDIVSVLALLSYLTPFQVDLLELYSSEYSMSPLGVLYEWSTNNNKQPLLQLWLRESRWRPFWRGGRLRTEVDKNGYGQSWSWELQQHADRNIYCTLEGLNDFNHYNITAANTSRRDRRFRLPEENTMLTIPWVT